MERINSYITLFLGIVVVALQCSADIEDNSPPHQLNPNCMFQSDRKSEHFKQLFVFSAFFMLSCRKNDPELNECIRKSIEMLRPKLSEGIPELLVPPCEPLNIPRINIKQNAGAIRMESDYTDVTVSGLSNFTLRSVRIDTANNKFRVNLWFPTLKMTANYHIQGKILLMSLAGDGPCTGNFSMLLILFLLCD